MARFNKIQNTFLAGEISPRAYGRTDLPEYSQGCKTLSNMIPFPQGGAGMRSGFQFMSSGPTVWSTFNDKTPTDLSPAEFTTWTSETTLFPFTFSRDEKYVFAFSKHTNGLGFLGQIRAISSSGTQYNVENLAALTSAGWSFDFTNVSDLREIQYAQSGDYIFFVHKNMRPFYIVRTAANTFEVGIYWYPYPYPAAGVAPAETRPFRPINITSASLKVSAVTANTSVTLTIAAGSGFAFTSDYVGVMFWLQDSGAGGHLTVTAYTSSTSVTAMIGPVALPAACAAGNGVTTWYEESWSDVRGWPRTITLFDQRLVFGGNASQPNYVWNTYQGNFFKFTSATVDLLRTGDVTDVDAFSYQLETGSANEISWLSSKKTILIGTAGNEISLASSGTGYAAGNVSSDVESSHGSLYAQPARLESAVAFVARSGQRLKELSFNLQEDTFKTSDLSLLAEHIPKLSQGFWSTYERPRIVQVIHQEHENGVLWMVDNNGLLFGTTRNKSLQVNAWHWHEIGGSLQSEGAKVMCITTIPSDDGDHDDVWAVIARTINNVDVYYIEKMGKDFDYPELITNGSTLDYHPTYLDSAVLISSPGSTTITGLDHLEGEQVYVIADGVYIGNYSPVSGDIDLSDVLSSNPSYVIVGLIYYPILEPLPIEAGSIIGSAAGTPKKLDKIKVRFFETAAAQYGPVEGNDVDIQIRPPTTAALDPTPLFTGIKTVSAPTTYGEDLTVQFTSVTPLPFKIASIMLRGMTND